MSKHFEEARLVITADIVYDPDGLDLPKEFYQAIDKDLIFHLTRFNILSKNTKVELQGFICDGK
jgi:hypothetical protein